MNRMNIDLSNWREFFVEKEPRRQQVEVFDFLQKNYNKYKNILLNCATGTGKSAIALTLARTIYSNQPNPSTVDQKFHSYITTTSLQLQDQYIASYQNFNLRNISSAANFKCTRNISDLNCQEGKALSRKVKSKCRNCPYDLEKLLFLKSPVGITNLAYYLYQTEYAFDKLPKRELMIFDEGHRTEDWIRSFITFSLSKQTINNFQLQPPKPKKDGSYIISELKEWIFGVYSPRLLEEISHLELALQEIDNESDPEYISLHRKLERILNILTKFQEYEKEWNSAEWVAEWSDDKILVTPLSSKKYMDRLLFSKNNKNVIMSATLLDKDYIIKEYGLEPDETCFFSLDSEFPKENRPTFYLPCGKIKHDDLEKTTKPFSEMTNNVLKEHINEKGIIFTTSYKQTQIIKQQTKNDRLLTHESSKDKNETIDKHFKSKNTVLLSPTMNEGLDLKDDLSRFQIMLKMPFPSLGSIYNRKKADRFPEWYAYQTVLTLIQMSGRSVRSKEDHCVTYIFDENFLWFYKKWIKFFPKYWRDALHT